jgi:tetratricopeptide (TPR) repeat protein
MAQRALAASDREALGATASSARAGASAVPVAGARLARRDFTAASPVVAAESDNGAASIVVTGSRVGKAAANAARRGDWNACTVDDPDRRLDRCERQVNPKAKGDAGRAAARIADGLEKAWAGDMDAAIAAFDAAIAIRPEDAFAHLNRGLALRQRGEIEQAVAEYDAAIRYAPQEARGYYHRSVALRAMGETKRAERDEERAVSLDSRYEELVE